MTPADGLKIETRASEIREKEGLAIKHPQEERDKLRDIAIGAWNNASAESPMAAKALDAHRAFMKKTSLLTE